MKLRIFNHKMTSFIWQTSESEIMLISVYAYGYKIGLLVITLLAWELFDLITQGLKNSHAFTM
jgi:hypothetical protein